jgi:phosphatidylserine/phosphatidylglycerophosphate/cardiolipin synthase-like enzyme
MDELLLATGFTGGLTLVFIVRWIGRWLRPPGTAAAYFSPKGGCTEAVVQEIKRARQEVLLQAAVFTSKPIALALADAKGRGLHVDILLDSAAEKETWSELKEELGDGLTPFLDAEHGAACSNIIVIDGRTVLTGSFSFTESSEDENVDNLLVLRGHYDVAKSYRQSFLEHKAHAKPAERKKTSAAREKDKEAKDKDVERKSAA